MAVLPSLGKQSAHQLCAPPSAVVSTWSSALHEGALLIFKKPQHPTQPYLGTLEDTESSRQILNSPEFVRTEIVVAGCWLLIGWTYNHARRVTRVPQNRQVTDGNISRRTSKWMRTQSTEDPRCQEGHGSPMALEDSIKGREKMSPGKEKVRSCVCGEPH